MNNTQVQYTFIQGLVNAGVTGEELEALMKNTDPTAFSRIAAVVKTIAREAGSLSKMATE